MRVFIGSVRRVDTAALWQFLAVDVLLVFTPGADWAYAIRAGLRREHVVAAVAGLAGGYVVHGALVTIGVGALLARDRDALSVVTFIGAVYLVGLGLSALRVSAEPATTPGSKADAARASTVAWRGALVSGLNPKGLLLFFAVLPQFVRTDAAWPESAQLAVYGCLHVAACALVYAAVAYTARAVLATRGRMARRIELTSGALMACFGALLATQQTLALTHG